MFIHQTHSFYIVADLLECENAPEGYLKKKKEIFEKALSNIGVETIKDYRRLWQLTDVMYASADDIFDIISNEMMRIVASDSSIVASEKKLYELSAKHDHVIVSEFMPDNTYYLK